MAEFARLNGTAVAGSNYGLTPRYFKIDAGNVDLSTNYLLTPRGNGNVATNFEKTARTVGTVASIITLGVPSGNLLVVQVDNTANLLGADSVAGSFANTLKSVLTANAVVVTESTGFVGGAFDTFA